MRRVFLGCSTLNHLRYVQRLVPEFQARGAACEIIHMDRANSPDAGGVAAALASSTDPVMARLAHTAFDEGLGPIQLPEAGFRSLSLTRRIGILRSIPYPKLDLTGALVIVFNDSGAFERRLLWEARRAGAYTVFVQDGLTNLRPRNPLTQLYFNLLKRTSLYLYAPFPQGAGPWDLGFFVGDFWARYAESWHLKMWGSPPVCRTLGQFIYWDESPASPSAPSSAEVPTLGILCATYENVRDWTPEAEAEFYSSFTATLKRIPGLRIRIRRHPRQGNPDALLQHLHAAGLNSELTPRTQTLHEFSKSADLFFSLGSYAAFEILRMGKPCFWTLRPFSIMAKRIADVWGEPSTESALTEFADAVESLRQNSQTAQILRDRLAKRYEPCVSQQSMTAKDLVAAIEEMANRPRVGQVPSKASS